MLGMKRRGFSVGGKREDREREENEEERTTTLWWCERKHDGEGFWECELGFMFFLAVTPEFLILERKTEEKRGWWERKRERMWVIIWGRDFRHLIHIFTTLCELWETTHFLRWMDPFLVHFVGPLYRLCR